MHYSLNRALHHCGLLLGAAILSSCSIPGITLFQNNESGMELAAGQSMNTHFFTKELNHDTGVSLISGQDYILELTLLSNWVDSTIAENESGESLDEKGFDNSLMRFEAVGLSRRSRSHRWFELMLQQPACSGSSLSGVTDLSYDEENDQYRFTATCSGKLNLFVNDTYGFYSNNLGYANITLSRVN